MQTEVSRYVVRLAETEADRRAAERLRYRVFVEEMGAAVSPEMRAAEREWDAFDPFFDHLLLIDLASPSPDPLDHVVGVYRLMTSAAAAVGKGFYSATEFDLGPILSGGRPALELGRSCVAREHRGGAGLHLLWNGLAAYVMAHGIEILFGAASFPGTDPAPLVEALSHLHHAHLAPPDLRVRVRAAGRLAMPLLPREAIDPMRAMRAVPPLIKAYLRLGGFIGEGAFVDDIFSTIDVCVVMDTGRMTERHRQFYARSQSAAADPPQRAIPGDADA